MTTRLFFCPACDGDGVIDHNRSRDPQQEDTEDCGRCDGLGRVRLDADAGQALGLRPYSVSRRRWRTFMAVPYRVEDDPLTELARTRRTGARWRSAAYSNARARAMRPVKLRGAA